MTEQTDSQPKHTPGPWKIVETFFRGDRILGVTFANGKMGFPIAPLSKATERDRADARLIAAAPDMLAALIKARDSFIYTDDHSGTAVMSEADNHCFSDIWAAIAKATGATP